MIASDIVTQLRLLLPQLTDKFTDDIVVKTIGRGGTEMTVNCDDVHNLKVGRIIAISGTDVPITISSFTRIGAIGTIVTASDHDLTLPIASTVRVTGAVEVRFTGTFTTINVINRRTITVEITDAGPTTATGTPELRDAESALRDYNSTYEVANIISPTQFSFQHLVTGLANPDGDNILARVKPRISSGINFQRCLDSYTSHKINEYWAFVVLGGVNSSQSRLIESDALDNQQRNVNYRQQIIQPFTVYVFIPVSNEIAGGESRDEASNLFRPLLRSLLFSKFDSGLYAGAFNPVQFVGHDVQHYDTGLYVHAYDFQQVADVYEEDTVGPDLDVAFRNIDFTQKLDFGTQVNFMQGTIDLDDTP